MCIRDSSNSDALPGARQTAEGWRAHRWIIGVMPLMQRVRTDNVLIGSFHHESGEPAASAEWWQEPCIARRSTIASTQAVWMTGCCASCTLPMSTREAAARPAGAGPEVEIWHAQ